MYGRADGMPSFQLTVAVRTETEKHTVQHRNVEAELRRPIVTRDVEGKTFGLVTR